MTSETNVLFFSLLGGIIPALLWLWFWIREDRLHPEPKSALFSAFVGGIFAMLLALFLELIVYYVFVDASSAHINNFPDIIRNLFQNLADKFHLLKLQENFWDKVQGYFSGFKFVSVFHVDMKRTFLLVIAAPIIEEALKLIMTYNICLRKKVNDEPIDASIYLLTAALGFAAIETSLFLTDPLAHGNIMDSFVAGNFRSVGPMLIHLISSAMLGIFIGLAYFKSPLKKFFYLVAGFLVAIIMHAVFNFFIMLNDTTHNINFLWVACIGTWILMVVLLVFFEKIKKVVPKPEI